MEADPVLALRRPKEWSSEFDSLLSHVANETVEASFRLK
jgi:hypothetical protein